jgi:hypothetical protein
MDRPIRGLRFGTTRNQGHANWGNRLVLGGDIKLVRVHAERPRKLVDRPDLVVYLDAQAALVGHHHLEIVRRTAGSMVALGRTVTLERSRGQPCRRVCQHWSAAPRRSDPSRRRRGCPRTRSAKLVDDARSGNLGRHTFFCFVRPILSRFNESDDVRSPNFGPVANN